MLGYLGRVTVETIEAFATPKHNLRIAAMFHQIEETGINALPIVGLLAFLIGVVLAYQGADQLKRFGAEIFTINLLGVGILREIGGLITAIIVAGRSGSAFTAQIGTMRVNEEIDAMQTMGLNTVDTLVLPRIIGLVIALPLLTFYADIMGLIGGAVMCYFDLGITIPVFMRQLQRGDHVNTLMVGLIKAPVFAFVIALVGCYEGFQVERNAASVGQLTTRSVVEWCFPGDRAGCRLLDHVLGAGDLMADEPTRRRRRAVIKVRGLVNGFGDKVHPRPYRPRRLSRRSAGRGRRLGLGQIGAAALHHRPDPVPGKAAIEVFGQPHRRDVEGPAMRRAGNALGRAVPGRRAVLLPDRGGEHPGAVARIHQHEPGADGRDRRDEAGHGGPARRHRRQISVRTCPAA